MSEHEQNHGSDSEEDAQSSPTLAPTNPIPANTTLTDRVSTGPSSKEAPELPRRATRIGTAVHPPFVWPQPRDGSHTAGESTRAAGRRPPAAIRTAAVATQESVAAAEPEVNRMIDQRPGGGFLNADAARPKSRKMKWTAENDRSLLLFGFGRDISGVEYPAIANWFEEKPTAKAVQERLTKLRAAGRKVLKESGIFDPDAPRDSPVNSRAPSVVQTGAPTQQQSARRHTVNLNTRAAPPAPSRAPVNESAVQHPSTQRLDPAPTAVASTRRFKPANDPLGREFSLPPTLMSQPSEQPHRGPMRGLSYPPYQNPILGTSTDFLPDGTATGMQRGHHPLPSSSVRPSYTTRGFHMSPPAMSTDQQQSSRSHGQQPSENATAAAHFNANGMTGQVAEGENGEGIDELRRSQMELESARARRGSRGYGGM